jgi:hypothetical protein
MEMDGKLIFTPWQTKELKQHPLAKQGICPHLELDNSEIACIKYLEKLRQRVTSTK